MTLSSLIKPNPQLTSERGYFADDVARYGPKPFILQPAIYAVAVYRFGRWTLCAPRVLRRPLHAAYFAAYSVVRLVTGIDMPRSTRIGPGLLIHHFGGIIFHPTARIGANCTLRHGVTIGARAGTGAPTIGDDVAIGAYAQILGDITVGDRARIGAMAVVLKNVPADARAVGNPARLLDGGEKGALVQPAEPNTSPSV
jgi:serine O-acetyltransferase